MIKDWDKEQAGNAPRPALTFTNPIVLAYWRTEAQLQCHVSLGRLRMICEERGCDYEMTIEGLKTCTK